MFPYTTTTRERLYQPAKPETTIAKRPEIASFLVGSGGFGAGDNTIHMWEMRPGRPFWDARGQILKDLRRYVVSLWSYFCLPEQSHLVEMSFPMSECVCLYCGQESIALNPGRKDHAVPKAPDNGNARFHSPNSGGSSSWCLGKPRTRTSAYVFDVFHEKEKRNPHHNL